MKVQTTRPFDRDYARLPEEVKTRVDKQLALLLRNPQHPSLRLKKMRGDVACRIGGIDCHRCSPHFLAISRQLSATGQSATETAGEGRRQKAEGRRQKAGACADRCLALSASSLLARSTSASRC